MPAAVASTVDAASPPPPPPPPQVFTNADTPEDAAEARRNGAEGIGLVTPLVPTPPVLAAAALADVRRGRPRLKACSDLCLAPPAS